MTVRPRAMSFSSRHINTARLSWAAYAGMFVFGIVMALLGAILPLLSARLNFSLSQAGTLFLYMNGAMLACSLVVGLVIDRFGHKTPLVLGSLLIAIALGLVIAARQFGNLLPALVLLGLGGGALNGATNTLAADLHEDEFRKASALSLLGVFFGLGALFLPFVMGALLSTLGMDTLLIAAAALCILASAYTVFQTFPVAKQAHGLPVSDMPRFLGSALVLTMAALLFFQSGIEFTLGGFLSTFLVRAHQSSVTEASWGLSVYWTALLAARLALSRVLLHIAPATLTIGCALVAALGCLAAALAPSFLLAAAAVGVTGFALAGVYPTVLAIAGARFREHSGTVFGILFTVALVGGMTLPWVAGNLAERDVRLVLYLVAGAFAAVFALAVVIRSANPPVTSQQDRSPVSGQPPAH